MAPSRIRVRDLYRDVPRPALLVTAALIAMVVTAAAHSVGSDPVTTFAGTCALLTLTHLWLSKPATLASAGIVLGAVALSPVIAAAAVTIHGSGSLTLMVASITLGIALVVAAVHSRTASASPRRLAIALTVFTFCVLSFSYLTIQWAVLAALICAELADAGMLTGRAAPRTDGAMATLHVLDKAPDGFRITRFRHLRGTPHVPEVIVTAPSGVFVMASVDAYAAPVTMDPVVTVGEDNLAEVVERLDSQCRAAARAARIGGHDAIPVIVLHRTALTSPGWTSTPAGRPLLVTPGESLLSTLSALPHIADDRTVNTVTRRLRRAGRPSPW